MSIHSDAELLAQLADDREYRNERLPITRWGERDTISKAIRYLVHQRDGFQCVKCGRTPHARDKERRSGPLHVDHVIPWSNGGSDKTSNLRTLCEACNVQRGNKRDDSDTYVCTPIVKCCIVCLGFISAQPAPDAFEVWCAAHRHLSWENFPQRIL